MRTVPGRRAPAPPSLSVPGERHRRRAAGGGERPQPLRRPRRGLRALSTLLMVAGALVLGDAVATVTWKEPVTAFLTDRTQAHLADDLRALQRAPPTRPERAALADLDGQRERIAFLARSLQRRAATGSAVGRITIRRIDASYVVVKGSDAAALRKGPGTYDDVAFPGVPGTAAIAGHRTTYLAPFRHLDDVRPGDAVTVQMPYATFTYRVERTRIVAPDDLSILARRSYDRLVLSACHPLFSASHRIVVLARLVRTVPSGQLRA